MAIAEDASSPAAVHATGLGPYTTATFSPPAASLILVMLATDGTATAVTGAITDSGSHTYTLLKRQNTATVSTVGGTAEVWVFYSSGALSNVTVTATMSGGVAAGANLVVKVLTGAKTTQTGATAGFSGTGSSTAATSISTTTTGAHVYGAVLNYASSTAYTANANSTIIDGFSDAVNGDWYAALKAASDVGTPGGTSIGFTNSNANFNLALAEILPAPAAFIAAPARTLRQAVNRSSTY